MILLGCTNGGNQCAPISTLPVAYQSEALCLAARADMVAASTGLGYERVIADCRSQGPAGSRREGAKASSTA